MIKGIDEIRYINSFKNAMRKSGIDKFKQFHLRRYQIFRAYLGTLVIDGEKLNDKEINYLTSIYDNGKLELETWAEKYVKENYKFEK